MIIIIEIDTQVNLIITNNCKFYLHYNNIMKFIILLIIGLIILLCLSGMKEHYINKDFLIDNHNYDCPFPWNKYQTFIINNQCKIRKSYLLLDAPDECCNKHTVWGKVKSGCSKEDIDKGDCGDCQLEGQNVKLKGTIFTPYQKFNTYCRPFIKYNWKMKSGKI